jgi:radical SAM protein with 4Fe4S-binding SPASM domain
VIRKLRKKIVAILRDGMKRIVRVAPVSMQRKLVNRIYRSSMPEYLERDGETKRFDTVFFELRTRCNGKCNFCAASIQNETRPDLTMPFDLYTRVIEQLENMEFAGRVAYHVNNDPLIVPEIEKFVHFARERLPGAHIQILTNGKALTPTKAEKLLTAGINELSVNHYDDNLSSPLPNRLTKVRDEILPNFYSEACIKTGHGGARGSEKGVIYFNIFRRRETEILTNRAGSAPNKQQSLDSNLLGFCRYPFAQFNITTDGRVSKCCQDLYFDDPMGNIAEQELLDIWRGDPFREVRSALLANDRGVNPMCANCDYFGVRQAGLSPWDRLVAEALSSTDE